ncbi:MAG TPA: PAS domain S-box protein, partial [Candidatus Saccharimonadales bacterium]|nr:PAS domain S-box protein [Candidatus Saccharimonadales bacterium]
MKMLVQQKIQAGFAVALAFLLLTGVTSWWSEQRNAAAFRAADHSYKVLDQFEVLLVEMLGMETGHRGFAISGDEKFLEPYQDGIAKVQQSFAAAKQMTQDNPDQQRRLAILEPLIQKKTSIANEAINLRRSGDTAGALQLIATGQGQQTMEEIRKLVAEMEAVEEQLLQQRTAQAQAAARMTKTIMAFTSLLAIGLVGLASVIVRRDFERRQQAEAAQRLSNARYNMLFDSIDEGYCIIEMIFDKQEKPVDYRFLEINPAFEKHTGLREAQGKSMRELAPQHEAHWFETYGRVALTGEAVRFQNRAEQLQRWYDVYAFRFGEPENRQVAILFNDITAQKQSEEALRRSEEEFRSMAEAMPQIVWATRPDGWNIFFNQQWVDYTGLTLEESYGHGWNKPFHPDDKQRAWDAWQRATQNNERYSLECRLRRADGVYHWWLIRGAQMRNANGEVVKWFGTCTDIEESKQAEEALRRSEEKLTVTLQSIGDAVLATDGEGRVTRLNLNAEKLTGWTHAEALGQPVAEVFRIFNEETRAPAVIPVDKVLATGEIHGLAKHTIIIARDGTERPIADSAAPIRDKEGKILGVVLVFRDVTEEHATQRALRESEQRVRLAIEAADMGVWAWDINSGAIHWDDRMFAFYGLPPKPDGWVAYEDWRARVLPGEVKEQEAKLQSTVATCGHSQREFRITRASDQATRVIHAAEMAIAGVDGKAAHVVGINIDITERKRMEETQARFVAIIESSDDAIISKSLDGIITSWNPGAERLFGYTAAEIIGTPMTRLFPPDRLDEAPKILARLKNGEHLDQFETVRVTKDGRQLDVSVTISLIKDAAGHIIGASKIVRDIADLKQAQEKIRRFNEGLEKLVAQRTVEVQEALATLDATKDGAYIFDPASLRFSYVNKGAMRQLGYTREELLKLTPLDLNTKHDEPAYREMIAPLMRGEKSMLSYERVLRRKDGGTLAVEVNLQYITPEDGSPRFIAIVRDITERKKAEQQAMRSQRLESIGTLAGGVAHDLNNALAPIMMSGELLRMQYPDETQTLDMIAASGKRAADMVRQLLSFAKGMEGERAALQAGRLVKEMEKIMAGSFPKNIQLVVKCDPKLPLVLGDSTQLHQVLLNLCVNARDAMPHGGTLTLDAQQKKMDATYASSIPDAKPGNYVALRVRDTGTGIPPEILDQIFDPFFTTKGPDKGTGLGLSTVMGIIKGHGGFLQVYSQPGQGSTFTAYLPADRAGSDTEHVTKAAAEFHGQGETILFVDDEAPLRTVARAVLQRLNFKPLTATDGADGLIQAAQHRTELRAIITDLHMPHMDGLAFVRAVRRMLPD